MSDRSRVHGVGFHCVNSETRRPLPSFRAQVLVALGKWMVGLVTGGCAGETFQTRVVSTRAFQLVIILQAV